MAVPAQALTAQEDAGHVAEPSKSVYLPIRLAPGILRTSPHRGGFWWRCCSRSDGARPHALARRPLFRIQEVDHLAN